MNTKSMYDLKETLCTDLEQFARKGSMTKNDLDMVHTITDTIKNIDKITMMDEEGYSYGNGNWNAQGGYSNAMQMNDDMYSGRRSRRSGNYMKDYSGHDMEYNENRMRREMYN